MRRSADRLTRLIADAAALGWFRSVEVSGLDRVGWDRPVLVVASHQGGFVDPALLASVLPRLPRFLAMATLWRNPLLRPLLRFAGAIPVRGAADGATAGNVSSFASCHEVLRAGGVVAVFPEGQASDAPHLLRVKTGAARIALGARAAGVAGLLILPVGLVYEAKQRARSRAFVRVGRAIDLDHELAAFAAPGEPADDENRDAVQRLTAEIEVRLAEAALDFEDAAQAADLWTAAAVSLRREGGNPAWSPQLSDLEERADRLARLPAAAQSQIRAAAADYRRALDANQTDDRVVAAGPRHGLGTARLAGGVATVLVLPFALVGVVVNLPPAALVHLVGRRPAAPVTLATVKFLVGLVVFPLAWLAVRYWLVEELAHPWAVTAAIGPACGLVAAVVADRLRRARLARLRPGRLVLPDRAAGDLRDRRAWLIDLVRTELVSPAGTGDPGAGGTGKPGGSA